ncbi:hypothetical protein BsWGS_28216 [Bradybaena similaris]
MGKYVFIYFNVRGRGEAVRYLLKELGIDFEEIVCSADNWYTEWKPKMQFGQLPALRDGDLQVVQSNAILRHLARKHGLYGSSIEEAAIIDMLNDGVEDLRVKYGGLIYKNYEAGKDAYIAELPSQLQPFENLLSKSGADKSGFCVGNKRSFIDYNLMDILDAHLILAPNCLDKFPALSAFYKLIINRPAIAEHRKTEAFKKRTVNGNGKQ